MMALKMDLCVKIIPGLAGLTCRRGINIIIILYLLLSALQEGVAKSTKTGRNFTDSDTSYPPDVCFNSTLNDCNKCLKEGCFWCPIPAPTPLPTSSPTLGNFSWHGNNHNSSAKNSSDITQSLSFCYDGSRGLCPPYPGPIDGASSTCDGSNTFPLVISLGTFITAVFLPLCCCGIFIFSILVMCHRNRKLENMRVVAGAESQYAYELDHNRPIFHQGPVNVVQAFVQPIEVYHRDQPVETFDYNNHQYMGHPSDPSSSFNGQQQHERGNIIVPVVHARPV